MIRYSNVIILLGITILLQLIFFGKLWLLGVFDYIWGVRNWDIKS